MDGKADWMAYGLPVEGDEGPFLGDRLSDVDTCAVAATVGDARRLLDGSDDTLVVVAEGGLAVGEVEASMLDGHDDTERVLDVMDPVPTTVRPSVTVAALAEGGGGQRLVTTSDGRLLGLAAVEEAEHDHDGHDHDHDGHGHDQGDEAYEKELVSVMGAIEERFGDEAPSEADLRAFLHERLVAEGKSLEEADRFLDELQD